MRSHCRASLVMGEKKPHLPPACADSRRGEPGNPSRRHQDPGPVWVGGSAGWPLPARPLPARPRCRGAQLEPSQGPAALTCLSHVLSGCAGDGDAGRTSMDAVGEFRLGEEGGREEGSACRSGGPAGVHGRGRRDPAPSLAGSPESIAGSFAPCDVPPPAPRHILGPLPAARANKIILLPRPSRGGRRGGPRGHVKATLPPCPHGPPALSPHVCHSCPRAGRARSAWAVPCPGHVTPAQAAGHGCPRNGAGRDPGDHRGCPSARGWRAGSDPVSVSACTAPLLSPSPEMGCATAKGITPTPGQGPADVA